MKDPFRLITPKLEITFAGPSTAKKVRFHPLNTKVTEDISNAMESTPGGMAVSSTATNAGSSGSIPGGREISPEFMGKPVIGNRCTCRGKCQETNGSGKRGV